MRGGGRSARRGAKGRRGREEERERGGEGERVRGPHRVRLTVRTESDGVVYGWPDRSSCKAGAAHA
jgi:hypothetical protein